MQRWPEGYCNLSLQKNMVFIYISTSLLRRNYSDENKPLSGVFKAYLIVEFIVFKFPLKINTLTSLTLLFYMHNLGVHYTRILT